MVAQPLVDPLYLQVVRVLRVGFRIAAGLLIVGLAVALIRQEPLRTRADSFRDIPRVLFDLKAAGFIDLAIIAIVATPVAAVITILRGFLIRGETRFAGYTAGVLLILVASVVNSLVF